MAKKKSSKKKEKKNLPPWLNKDKDKDEKEEEVEEAMTLTADQRIKDWQKKEKEKKKKKNGLKESSHKKGKKGKKSKGKKGGPEFWKKNYPILDSNNINIVKFIKCMNEKNYAKANKYLQAVLENKMKVRIAEGGAQDTIAKAKSDDDDEYYYPHGKAVGIKSKKDKAPEDDKRPLHPKTGRPMGQTKERRAAQLRDAETNRRAGASNEPGRGRGGI